MKTRVYLFVLVCLLGWGLMFSVFSQPVSAQAAKPASIRLVYGNQNPETGWEVVNCSKPWIQKVKEATKGVVDIQGHYAQSLFKGTDALEAIKGGQADLGFIAMGFFPGVASLSEVITLPFLPIPSSEAAGAVLWQLCEKFPSMQKQYAGIKVLNFIGLGPFVWIGRDKAIKTIADFKGLKLRSLGGPPTDMLKALGAVPVFMGINDVYLNIEKGVIDGALLPWEAMLSFKPYEIAKHFTYAPFHQAFFLIGMNEKKWNSLSPDVQKQIMSVSGRNGSAWWSYEMSDRTFEEGRKIVKSKGTQMIEFTPPPDEIEKWRKVGGEPTWDKWVKDNEAKGFKEAKEILDATVKMLKEYKK